MNNDRILTNSVLKVTASEDLDIESDLASENISNKTISELLEETNEKEETTEQK